MGGGHACGCSHQDPEEVEVFSRPGVVTALILELGIPVEGVQVLLTELREKIAE